jgi:ligand-binding sensor domain-containing protein
MKAIIRIQKIIIALLLIITGSVWSVDAQSATANSIRDILNDDNDLWIVYGNNKLVKYNKNINNAISWQLSTNVSHKLAKDENGNIWIADSYKTLLKFDGISFVYYNVADSTDTAFPDRFFIMELYIDHNNTVWIGSVLGLYLTRYDGATWQSWSLGDGSSPMITDLYMDKSNILWVAGQANVSPAWTFGYFNQGHIVQVFDVFRGICAMCVDREGIFWLLSSERNLVKFDGNTFTRFYSDLLPFDSSKDIYIDLAIDTAGNKWTYFANKLVRFDGSEFKAYTHPDLQERICCIEADSNGDIWIGAEGRLFRYSMEQDAIVEVVLNTSGVGEVSTDRIHISPNPAHDFVNITGAADKSLAIYDISGRQILHRQIASASETVPVSSWEKGIYFVRIYGGGNDLSTMKLIIK